MYRSLKPGSQPGRETKDRENALQHKLAELNSQLQRLEKCMAMMRAENEVLRKKHSDQRLLEQKVRMLRKRNANLAAISRRLEERVRTLQDRDSRNGQKAKSVPPKPPEPSSRRRIQTRQASNPQTTYRRAAGVRGHAMDNLHRKCPKLTDLLHSADVRMPQFQKARHFEENQELVHIIKVAAKERLQLEHELAHSRMKMGAQLTENDFDGVGLSVEASITTHSPQCRQRLTRLLAENHQLQHTISCLREQAGHQAISPEECTALKLSLIAAQKEKEEAEKEAKYLSRRVHSLENVVRDLQESAEHVTQLENQRKSAVQQLQEKQAQLQQLKQVTSSVESSHTNELSSLSQQLAEAAEKLRLKEESRLKLIQEVQRLQKEAAEREKIAAELELAKQELARLHHEIITEPGEEKSTEISLLEVSTTSWNHQDQPSDDSLMSQWARNGPIQVYVAKYNYDPFQLSPNENPEAELVLAAGDYVLVVGDMDEDGFYDGELIDGSQGLVPSNYIEKVKDEDLCLFHEVLLHAGHWSHILSADSQLNNNNKTVHTLTAESSPATHSGISNLLHVASSDTSYVAADTDNNREYRHPRKDTADVEDENGNSQIMTDSSSLPVHGDSLGYYPPCPRNLWLDQQLPDSVHISWTAPEPSPGLQVHCYHVLVDGETRAVVGGSDRTKVVLEGISASSTCRVCVRCLYNQGQSRDAQCTMLFGKDAYPVPKELKLLHLSSTSAVLTWLPGNSNYQHSVNVNRQEVAVVRPGVFYHMLSELQPGTEYQVTVMARSASGVFSNITSQSWLQQVSASLQFSTPATVNTDLTVGTEASLHPPSLLREDSEGGATDSARQPVCQPVGSLDGEEQKGLETDEEIEEAFRLVEDLNQAGDRLSESSYTNSSRTELSDIPEVEEDFLGSQDSQLNQAGAIQVASRSPAWIPDRPATGEADDWPREFHAEKPVQFDGKPLAAPTPRTPTMAMQNPVTQQLVPARVEEQDLASTDSTPVDVPTWDQPAGDVHISRAFLTIDQTQQKNILNQLHLISVGGNDADECIGPKDPTCKTLPGFSDPAKMFSDNSRLHLVKETPTHELTESDTQPGNHVTTLPTSSFELPESSDDGGEISGDVSPVVKANSVRLFMALYDYHPATMSPNVDLIDEELSFREGQILKVFGDKDADGFYKGESNGIRGYIPCNLVCEVQIDDPKLRQQLLQDIADISGESQAVPSPQSSDDAPVITNGMSSSSIVPNKNILGRKMVAIYDYDPQELSPNTDAELELSLRAGDVVTIYGDMDEDGFFTGEVNDRCGLVPSNFLQPAPSINYRHST